MTTSEQNGNVMPSIPAHYEGKQSSKSTSKSTLMIGAVLYPRITLCQLCLIVTLGVIEREGVLGTCPFEVLHIISFSLDYWSIYWHLCSTIALSHVIFRSGWTSRAHLMYPVLSYQVVPHHYVHLPINTTALMVGILRVEERGNMLLKQLPLIAGLSYNTFQTGSRHTQVQGTIRQQAEMCSPEWVLKKPPALWMASWNVKAIIASQVCCTGQA